MRPKSESSSGTGKAGGQSEAVRGDRGWAAGTHSLTCARTASVGNELPVNKPFWVTAVSALAGCRGKQAEGAAPERAEGLGGYGCRFSRHRLALPEGGSAEGCWPATRSVSEPETRCPMACRTVSGRTGQASMIRRSASSSAHWTAH